MTRRNKVKFKQLVALGTVLVYMQILVFFGNYIQASSMQTGNSPGI